MHSGTYITRGAVADEVVQAAEQTPGVLGTSSRVQARRRPGAQVDLEARVRRGADTSAIQSDLRRSVREIGRAPCRERVQISVAAVSLITIFISFIVLLLFLFP